MNPPDNPLNPITPASGSLESVQQGFESLKTLFCAALVALVILSVSVDLFLLKQVSLARKQVEETQARVKNLTEDFQKNNAPLMGAFVTSLMNFARTNPDFVPIIQKYPIQAAPQPAAAPQAAPKK